MNAIYVRISEDPTGMSLGVQRQEAECRELAARLGLTVSEVFTDNDTSATSGVARPGFDALIASEPSAIIAWHQDRLLRKGADLERVIELNVPVYTVSAGTLDLTNPAGRAVARTVAAWSQYETEQKATRQLAKNRQLAESGLPVPGKRRYGFEPGNIVERPDEADDVRAMFQEMLDGKSLRSLSKARGWGLMRARDRLTNPAYAGWVVRRGERFEAHESVARIVSREDFERVQAILSDPSRKVSPGGARKHLLTGLATCGECGDTLHYSAHGYKCRASAAHVFIKGTDRMEAVVSRAAVAELAHRALNGSPNPEGSRIDALREELAAASAERSRLSALLTDPEIDPLPVRAALKPVAARLEGLKADLAEAEAANVEARILAALRLRVLADVREKLSRTEAQASEAGMTYTAGESVRNVMQARIARQAAGEAWEGLDLDDRRSLIRGMLTVVLERGRTLDRIKTTPQR